MLCALGFSSDLIAGEGISAKQLQNKLQLVEHVLTHIDKQGKDKLEANVVLTQAYQFARREARAGKQALEQGQFTKAEQLLSQALVNASYVSKELKALDGEQVSAEQYAQLLDSVGEYQAILEQTYQEKQLSLQSPVLEKVSALLIRANTLQKTSRYNALMALEQAYQLLTLELARLRDKETSVVSLDFATPEDEFNYELRQFDSLRLLLSLNKEKVSKGQQMMLDKFATQSEQYLRDAKSRAAAGDHQAAIELLEQGNKKLWAALRTLGLGY
jgi:hypothetical protein